MASGHGKNISLSRNYVQTQTKLLLIHVLRIFIQDSH